jgi:hypothetical protein
MAFLKETLVQFSMQAERLSQADPVFGASVSVAAIADAAGVPREDGYGVARYLQALGWAHVSFSGDTPLTLTPKGYEEIAKLRRPRWRRWPDEHPVLMNAFWMTLTGVVAGVLSSLLTAHWLK